MILTKEIQEIINSSSKNILKVEKNSSQIESTVLKIISTIKNGNKIILFGMVVVQLMHNILQLN